MGDKLLKIMVIFLICLLGFLFFISIKKVTKTPGFLCSLSTNYYSENEKLNYPLEALNNANFTSSSFSGKGRFFLFMGSASIEGQSSTKIYLRYIVKETDGLKIRQREIGEDVYINECGNCLPSVDFYFSKLYCCPKKHKIIRNNYIKTIFNVPNGKVAKEISIKI